MKETGNWLKMFWRFLISLASSSSSSSSSPGVRTQKMETQLWEAIDDNRIEDARNLLESSPGDRVNWKNPQMMEWTFLHQACWNGFDSLVSLLLGHPDINVNARDRIGATPFLWACFKGRASCVRLLLPDPRVDINSMDAERKPALWYAAHMGHVEVVKWLLASRRDLNTELLREAVFFARQEKHPRIVSLLERFRADPAQTRGEIRGELGCLEELAAETFALVLFLSDDLLRVRERGRNHRGTRRFFNIARRLPMELQMVLCHRAVGSLREIVPRRHAEPAFRDLTKTLLQP